MSDPTVRPSPITAGLQPCPRHRDVWHRADQPCSTCEAEALARELRTQVAREREARAETERQWLAKCAACPRREQ